MTSDNPQAKRSLLTFLGDALHWLAGMATSMDTTKIKQQVNSLIQKRVQKQVTLVHVISI